MSKVIDEKVVSMEFDNKRFERNVSTTINTIDKLKESLQFKDASKGFEEITESSKKVNMSSLGQSVDTVKLKFSALQIAAVTALTNITNSAVNAGKRLVASLSTDNIAAGWNKYEQKTGSVQTIMNATGKSVEEVNGYLSKLMWYSDETSYGFTDMTASLAQLTSAGGNIDNLIPMIEGIANATAFAGKGAAEFSRAIYNLNQSYSAGYLQYMDWKSLDLAGVSSKQLKQTLIDTAVELGKIQEGQITLENFASTLSDKWADTEVMEKAFSKFARLTEAAYDYVQTNDGATAIDAINELASGYDEVAVKAFKSAQEAKSFREAIEATKDAVSSGWMKTSEIIFGDYEKSKEVWSRLTDTLWDIFASGGKKRNEILQTALGSGWDSFMSDAVLYKDGFESQLKKLFGDKKIDINELINEEGSLEKAVQRALNDGTITAKDLSIALNRSVNELHNATDEQLKELGLTREIVNGWELSAEAVEGYAESISKLSGREMLIEGIANIGKSILTIFDKIKDAWDEVFPSSTASKANALYKGLSGFYNITEKLFNVISENGDKIKNVFVAIFTPIKWVTNAIKTLFNLIWPSVKMLASALSDIATIPLNVLSKIGKFFSDLKKNTKTIDNATTGTNRFKDALEKLCSGIKTYVKNIKDAMEQSKFLDTLLNVAKNLFTIVKKILSGLGNGLISFLEGLGNTFANADATTFVALLNTLVSSGILASLFKIIKDFSGIKKVGSKIASSLNGIRDTLKSFQNQLNAQAIKDIAVSIAILSAAMMALSLVDADKLWTSVKVMSALIVVLSAAFISIARLTNMFEGTSEGDASGIKKLLTKVGEGIGVGIKNFLSKVGTAHTIAAFGLTLLLLAGAIKLISTMDWKEMGIGLITMTVCMGLLVGAIGILSTVKDKDLKQANKNIKKLRSIAGSIAVLTVSLKIVSGIDWKEMGIGLISLGSIIILMTAATVLIGRFAKIGNKTTNKGLRLMMMISNSVLLISIPLIALSLIPWEKISLGLVEIASVIASLTLSTILIGRIAKIGSKATTKGIATLLFMATSLLMLTNPLITLSFMPIDKIFIAIGELSTLLTALTLSAILIGKFASAAGTGFVTGMAAILLLAVSLNMIMKPLIALSLMPLDNLKQGLASVGVILASLVLLSMIMATITGGGTMLLAVAGSIALLGVALNLLIVPVAVLSVLPLEQVAKGLGVLTASLLVLVGIGYLAIGASIGLIALGGSIALIGLGLVLAGLGMTAMSGGLASLLLILKENASLMSLLDEFSLVLLKVGSASIVAGVGFTLLAIGLVLLEVAVAFLPLAVKALNLFVDELAIFIEKLNKISVGGDILSKVGILAGLFGILIGIGMLSMGLIASALYMTLAALELQMFANTIKPFLNSLRKDITPDLCAKAGILTGLLGIMFGSSLVGVLSMLTSWSLSVVAVELSSFMLKLKPFLDGLKSINNDTLTKSKMVKQIIDMFTGGGFISSIANVVSGGLKVGALILFLTGIGSAIKKYYNSVKDVDVSTIKSSSTMLKSIIDSVKGISNLPKGFNSYIKSIGSAIKSMSKDLSKSNSFNGVSQEIKTLSESLKELSNTAVYGFVEAITGVQDAVINSFKNIINSTLSYLKSTEVYNSFYSAGQYLAEGFANGIDNSNLSMMGKAGSYSLDTTATKGLNKAMSQANSIIESGMGSQQTIRPVLDLNDIISDTNEIGNLFGSNKAVLSELGPVESSINRIQNRRSDDSLLTAILDLKNTLQNASGDTYNINGVSYDNGSEVQAAIETIVRAAILERRR